MSSRYSIDHISDIFDVPDDKWDDFLKDLTSYRNLMKPMMEMAKLLGNEESVLKTKFTWIDDGKHDFSVTTKVSVKMEDEEGKS